MTSGSPMTLRRARDCSRGPVSAPVSIEHVTPGRPGERLRLRALPLELRPQLRQPGIAGVEHRDAVDQVERLRALTELAAQAGEREDEVEIARVRLDEAREPLGGDAQL